MRAKRFFDIVVASIGLVSLLPLLLIIALLIKLTSKGPILFVQQRIGLGGQAFRIHKFRTMQAYAEQMGPKITIGKDHRITKIGRILRKTKLDELPQLYDVLLGKMSLVGPRPEVPEYVALYPAEIARIVLSVRPGITDWASITMIDEGELLAQSADPKSAYINQIMPQKLAYAVKYVQTRNLWQDCKIIGITLIKMFKR